MKTISLLFLMFGVSLGAADFQAGVARMRITPPLPFWLTGYASRTNPAASVRSDLWAKALALQDDRGERVVIVTTDLLGLPREVSDAVAGELSWMTGLRRSQLVLNSSHTHAGPVVWSNLPVLFDFDAAEQTRVLQYAHTLVENLTTVAAQALTNLRPAVLTCGHGSASFAMNRRQSSTNGVRIGENPTGPVDHDVPVLKVTGTDGSLRAVLFGYACHNTTLGGDFYQVDGDYAGAAQREVERNHPGATALFMMLCGGDQNPRPRGTTNLVEQHGRALAAAVEGALAGTMKPVRPPLQSSHRVIQLDFAPHTREQFAAEAGGPDKFRQRRARRMLAAYDGGKPVRQLPYPVQAIRFNDDLTLLALGGEVVVDYAHRARREFAAENLIIAGYCHDVSCYIPSRRVLREGGYEAVESMIYYGQPGPFAENVEDTIFQAVREVMKAAGAKANP